MNDTLVGLGWPCGYLSRAAINSQDDNLAGGSLQVGGNAVDVVCLRCFVKVFEGCVLYYRLE